MWQVQFEVYCAKSRNFTDIWMMGTTIKHLCKVISSLVCNKPLYWQNLAALLILMLSFQVSVKSWKNREGSFIAKWSVSFNNFNWNTYDTSYLSLEWRLLFWREGRGTNTSTRATLPGEGSGRTGESCMALLEEKYTPLWDFNGNIGSGRRCNIRDVASKGMANIGRAPYPLS